MTQIHTEKHRQLLALMFKRLTGNLVLTQGKFPNPVTGDAS